MAPEEWEKLSDEELMERKISQLGLKLEGSSLEPLIQQLYSELTSKGLTYHPPCYIGDEWFCPVGFPSIFIPFYLVNDRLKKLEQKIILEVEGETKKWFMQLMRHEAAHAYAYAFQLYRKKRWQWHFGLTSDDETPNTYRPRPYSRSYVIHLDDWYAQSHPDEDFAETFAVWLTPDINWRERYAGWNALDKLEYVDELMRSLAGKPAIHQPPFNPADFNCLNQKLKTYYARKRKLYEDSYPDFYDKDLKKIFNAVCEAQGTEKASHYLRKNRKAIMNSVCEWTNERKYRVNQLLSRLVNRCDELQLCVRTDSPNLNLQIASYITTLVMNYLFTGKFKRSK